MSRREEIAVRMADAIVNRLTTRKVVEVRDEDVVRAVIRHVVSDNIAAEERLEADARQLLLDHAKMIKDSAADYRQLLGKVKEKLAARPRIHPLMRMSRERIFHLADLIMKELDATEGVHIKAPDEVRPEIIRALTEEVEVRGVRSTPRCARRSPPTRGRCRRAAGSGKCSTRRPARKCSGAGSGCDAAGRRDHRRQRLHLRHPAPRGAARDHRHSSCTS